MHAAVLTAYGESPRYAEFEDPAAEEDGHAVIDVLAGGLNPVDISMASGTFYGGAPPLPSVVGREGVGLLDGKRVYFDAPVPPFGSFAERILVVRDSAIVLPDGLDEGLATSLGIAGLAAWLSLQWRAQLVEGESVLVLGASGVVGQIGVQAARLLGASRVVAATRSEEGLSRARELGADATVPLGDGEDLPQALRDAGDGGYDVVLDPLWGEPAIAALEALNPGGRLVQLGASAGKSASLASATIRGKLLTILGHTNFAAPRDVKRTAYLELAGHAARGEIKVEVERVPLPEVERAWAVQKSSPGHKLVIVPCPRDGADGQLK